MPNVPQLPGDSFNYKGVEIRCKPESGLVNLSDLWKSEGRPWNLRPDLWAKRAENRQFLESIAFRSESPAWLVIRGGSSGQGTFATPEIAVRYASFLSLECSDWLCDVLDTTSGVVKARRRTIYLGDKPLEVFQLASGEYRLSQTQVAEAIEKDESSFRKFLGSEAVEALPYKDFDSGKLPVEDSNRPINPTPIDLAIAYWTKEARTQNQIAVSLLSACAKETIERRADKAFGIQRTEAEYNFRFKTAFEKLADVFPESSLATLGDDNQAESMILAERDVLGKIKKKFPKEIFKLAKKDFIDEFVFLGATAGWHLSPHQVLSYPNGAVHRNAYPDLISQPAEYFVDGRPQRVILLLQYVDSIVNEKHIKDCFYLREYIELVKEHYQVDQALLFFVSPYGVTNYAAICIKEREELRGCVGVITVKQLAEFLCEKVSKSKRDNIRDGRLKSRFRYLMNYKSLEELANEQELKQLSLQPQVAPIVQLDIFDMFPELK